ncbi:tRNA pseudouridine(38-40) synthase TruA [Kocuria rosea]|uniref:tRNA pseudouridine(38-40) synthase TruA n=1 Tax=Kocuria rosea TaxID=1275 RepID=UPI00203E4744|nr:tRNA pseudouridine(38-40) synthase TruA [Kocuria rosea]MCM3687784.1 tRNA pseudouridine(38-40) synthase TruA [Kocuria rosea]
MTGTVPDAPVRVRIDLAYDGAPFSGWARQPVLPTVQGALEDALAVLVRREVRVVVAGRTDTGVHARGQVVHLDLTAGEWTALARGRAEEPATALGRRLSGALAHVLGRARREQGLPECPGAIVVRRAAAAPAGFDARFSAVARRYSYRIDDGAAGRDPLTRHLTWWTKDVLDADVMAAAAQELVGLHDFLSFCRPREGATTVREVLDVTVERDAGGLVVLGIEADAFCHHMVRSIVGAAARVGAGREEPGWLGRRLADRVRDAGVLMAPAHALVLEEVRYPGDAALRERAELTRARRDPLHPGPAGPQN